MKGPPNQRMSHKNDSRLENKARPRVRHPPRGRFVSYKVGLGASEFSMRPAEKEHESIPASPNTIKPPGATNASPS